MRLTPLLAAALAALGALLACGKSQERLARDVELCSDTAVARRIAACLRSRRGWDSLPSESAGAVRARELDSLYRWQEDSAWNLDRPEHEVQLQGCLRQRGQDVAACLRLAGWPAARASRTADSAWASDSVAHRRQIQSCVRTARRSNIADCLLLYYQWETRRALAANDSVQRAAAGQR